MFTAMNAQQPPKLKPSNYMVLLVAGLSDENARMLEPIVYSYHLHGAIQAKVLWCKSVGASGLGPFVHVNAKRRTDGGYIDAHIPTSIILSIVGADDLKAMGFRWAEQNQSPELEAVRADGPHVSDHQST